MTSHDRDEQIFDQIDFSEQRPFEDEIQSCTFKNCNFTETDLSELAFINCAFTGCNLSMTKLGGTRFQNVEFTLCKLMGVDFSACSDFVFDLVFNECNLNFTSFARMLIKETKFTACSIKEANFSESDLKKSVFVRCDLSQSVFHRTNLTSADFRTAIRFSIDPDQNQVKNARFSYSGLPGLLEKYELLVE